MRCVVVRSVDRILPVVRWLCGCGPGIAFPVPRGLKILDYCRPLDKPHRGNFVGRHTFARFCRRAIAYRDFSARNKRSPNNWLPRLFAVNPRAVLMGAPNILRRAFDFALCVSELEIEMAARLNSSVRLAASPES